MSSLSATRSLGTRVAKKIEKPKPLKTSVARHSAPDVPARFSAVSSMEDVMSLVNRVVKSIASRNYLDVQTNTSLLTSKLKAYGPQLEDSFKDQLDRAFVSFRNACRDEQLEVATRKSLLYLVELRAMQWQSSSSLNAYYCRSFQPELEGGSDISISGSLSQISNAPLLLSPGEVLKPSGKFSSPTKMPGKNYCKDEVVIRNGDSGKVNPGAKERLVQITGPTEEKIEYAKHLMEDTIKRNASPVREVIEKEHAGGSNSSLNSSTSDESNRLINTGQLKMKKLPINNIGLFDYKHTVNVNDDTIHIASFNLDLVREAKIVLDEYFNGEKVAKTDFLSIEDLRFAELKIEAHDPARDSVESDTNTLTTSSVYPAAAVPQLVALRHPQVETAAGGVQGDIDTNLTTSINHQNESHTRSTTFQQPAVVSVPRNVPPSRPKYEYSRQFLLDCSESYKSHQPPKHWDQIVKDYPSIVKQVIVPFDGVSYMKKWMEVEGKPVAILSDCNYVDSD